MKNLKETVKQVIKTLVTNMVEQDSREWPPTCLLFAYQPERPPYHLNNMQDESAPSSITEKK